jgi:hypothetical protein
MAKKLHIDAKALGLSLGLIGALSVVIISIWVATYGTGMAWVDLINDFYLGYEITIVGTILGAIYGFIDGFVGGWLIGWLYNKFAK